MANQPQQLTRQPPRTFTRTDFAALRARVQGLPLHAIAQRYYDADWSPQAATAEGLDRHLHDMRDELVRLAILHGSPALADHLKASMRKHGSAKLSAVTLRMVEQAAQLGAAVPQASHGVGLWFRALIAKRLSGEGICTLGELVTWCNTHGSAWWRSLPRIGPLRARTIVAWLRKHEASLGVKLEADVDIRELVPAAGTSVVIGGPPERPHLAPFERMAVPAELSGGDGLPDGNGGIGGRRGTNRADAFAYIRAPHDLAALHAWLHRYRDRPATLRTYTREVERFVLWTVIVRGVAVSSVTVEDCEAYKDFLAAPALAFTGPRRARASGAWRPFTGTLSVDSQAYGVRVLRAAFAWLVSVRYLAGNPWHAVRDPATTTRETAMCIERALPARVWAAVRAELAVAAQGDTAAARQWRIARAAILLMGDSGPRRAEVATARREALHPDAHDVAPGQAPVWMLGITGKGRRARSVPVSPATLEALRAHWADRGRDFDEPGVGGALIAPLSVPATRAAREKSRSHAASSGDGPGYSVNALGNLVSIAVRRLVRRLAAREDVQAGELVQLASATSHAFRHTFGTQAARSMPVDVIGSILGHAHLQTTSIYVRPERRRIMREAARYHADQADGDRQSAQGGRSDGGDPGGAGYP